MISALIGILSGLLIFFLCRSRDRRKINRLERMVAEKHVLLEESEYRRLVVEAFSAKQNEALNEAGSCIENHLIVYQALQEDHQLALKRIRDLLEEVRAGKEMEMSLLGEMIELGKQVNRAQSESIRRLQDHEKTLSVFN